MTWLVMVMLGTACLPAQADIAIRLSVKFILSPPGTQLIFQPGAGRFDVSTRAAIEARIVAANQTLEATGWGYYLKLVEEIDIQPQAPDGQPADYWYNIPARSERRTIEFSAFDQIGTPWRWNRNAINIYINNSQSGSCSFVGDGTSIALEALCESGMVPRRSGHKFWKHAR